MRFPSRVSRPIASRWPIGHDSETHGPWLRPLGLRKATRSVREAVSGPRASTVGHRQLGRVGYLEEPVVKQDPKPQVNMCTIGASHCPGTPASWRVMSTDQDAQAPDVRPRRIRSPAQTSPVGITESHATTRSGPAPRTRPQDGDLTQQPQALIAPARDNNKYRSFGSTVNSSRPHRPYNRVTTRPALCLHIAMLMSSSPLRGATTRQRVAPSTQGLIKFRSRVAGLGHDRLGCIAERARAS